MLATVRRQGPVRVAAYCRVSTEEQASEGHSIGTQKAQIEDWCRQHLADQSYALTPYVDEGYSGKLSWEAPSAGNRRFRPELARLVHDVHEGRLDLVVVYRIDRLTRSMAVWARFMDECLADGRVRFVSLSESIDLSRTDGRLTANMLAAVASFQRDVISDNVRDALRKRKLDGLPVGMTYGWRSVPQSSPGARPTVEPDPEQAPWVPRVYAWFLKGWSTRRIARQLNREGAPAFRNGERWLHGSVARLLSNPLHCGYLEVDGKLIRAQAYDMRLIERDTYDEAMRIASRRRRDGKCPSSGDTEILYKIARCGRCGQRLGAMRTKSAKGARSYRCRGSDADERVLCQGWQKDARLVDRVVLKHLSGFVNRSEFRQLLDEETRHQVLDLQVSDLHAQREQLSQAIARVEDAKKRLLRAYTNGHIDEALYDLEAAKIQRDLADLTGQRGEVDLRCAAGDLRERMLEEVQRAVTQLPELWEHMNPEERRHILQEVIEYCYVDPLEDRMHRVRLKFHFLPEITEELPCAKSRATGLFDDVAHLTPRELAYLTLASDGLSDKDIRTHWQVTSQATYFLRRSILNRLGTERIEDAVELARGRIANERDTLPLGPTSWHGTRVKSGIMQPRAEEALVRLMDGKSLDEIAYEMGIRPNTVESHLWRARTALNCNSLEEAVAAYLEQKGGRLPDYGQRLPLEA
ncbi:MAG: recombinase family protein [Acidobacteriota bacterium]|nr:recombinase family protein [Acidobacteriota bacterium]